MIEMIALAALLQSVPDADSPEFDAKPHAEGFALIETAVRAQLKDPDSAKFEWPHGFVSGSYRIPLEPKVTGWVTCGTVNAKNGYGGYAGRSPVIAAIRDRTVVGLYISQPNGSLVQDACAKVGLPMN